MLTILLALLLQLHIMASEADWHQLSPQEQQALQDEFVIDDDLHP